MTGLEFAGLEDSDWQFSNMASRAWFAAASFRLLEFNKAVTLGAVPAWL
jgi:hypothetical protein